jgi:outer membrane biosynthesis protein TonB
MRGGASRFHACYVLGLAKNPRLEGNVVLRFVIDPAGGVATGQAEGASTLSDREVLDCMVRELRTFRFPKPSGGFVTVLYPLVLKPG